MADIYEYKLEKRDGSFLSLSDLKDKVIIIVNTATGCGFTPHYEPLEKMYEEYHDKGLEIIDIPCNQFGSQAPGSDDDIHSFCTLNYKTKFEQFKKSNVNGENALPLYKFLKSKIGFSGFGEGKMADLLNDMLSKSDQNFDKNPDIKWNFTKFVIDRNGNVVKRFEPTADMKDVEDFIKTLL